ncbi:hypothetical protein GCM10023322_60840 [Rugosimonospora acidiphila]|uniref:Uncharacterized protein n=1 Tax=Rugosimonospora acidiphila TaxID=556531 RepID=A0ABP9SEV5_9ACTN
MHVRLHHFDGFAAGHTLPSVDGHRQVQPVSGQLIEATAQAVPFWTSRRVRPVRFITWLWYGGNGIHGGLLRRDLGGIGEATPILARPADLTDGPAPRDRRRYPRAYPESSATVVKGSRDA